VQAYAVVEGEANGGGCDVRLYTHRPKAAHMDALWTVESLLRRAVVDYRCERRGLDRAMLDKIRHVPIERVELGAASGQEQVQDKGHQVARPRRGGEPNQPPMDPVTQQQIQTWLQAKPDDKSGLLDAVAELDRNELGNVHRIATEEEAKQTPVAIEGLLVAREQRIARIKQQWQEYAERMQRLQERMDQRTGLRGRGMQNTQTNQPTTRRGRRYR
jgi:hypothetical protein